jgi:hypothetical protein
MQYLEDVIAKDKFSEGSLSFLKAERSALQYALIGVINKRHTSVLSRRLKHLEYDLATRIQAGFDKRECYYIKREIIALQYVLRKYVIIPC